MSKIMLVREKNLSARLMWKLIKLENDLTGIGKLIGCAFTNFDVLYTRAVIYICRYNYELYPVPRIFANIRHDL